jgi:hypothetical protein
MDDFPCIARQVQSKCMYIVPADGLGCLCTIKYYFIVNIKWVSLAMAAWANPINFRPNLIILHIYLNALSF